MYSSSHIQPDPTVSPVRFVLRSGVHVGVRPLAPNDVEPLGAYFDGLSEQTRRLFGPHPLDTATARNLCATIDLNDALRLVATVESEGNERIVAYLILKLSVSLDERRRYESHQIILDPTADATLAPSVADDYQNRGLGSPLMTHAIAAARWLGRRRLVLMGGTQANNQRAIHFYRKHGFRIIARFEHPPGSWNHDMMLEVM